VLGVNKLKELRKEAGLSRFRLAVEAGLTPGAVMNLERGIVSPRAMTIKLLARALAKRLGRSEAEVALELLEEVER